MNITLLTQLYPTVNRPDLFLDTEAIHHFAKEWVKQGHKVTVFHMYLHDFRDIRKYKLNFGWKITQNKLDGVSIYMMENRCTVRFKSITKMQMAIAAERYNKIIPKLEEQDVLLVHLPCMLDGFIEKLKFKCPRIAILHNADIKRFSNGMVDVEKAKKLYDGFGFRSLNIKNSFHNITSYDGKEFIAHSGSPRVNHPKNIRRLKQEKTLKILYVGKLIPLKKIDITLQALKLIKDRVDFQFRIIGEGEEKPYLEKLTGDLGLKNMVSFMGRLPRLQVLEEMRNSDVFVMVSSPETFGLVYIEAMSCGCITIGSKGEGIDGVLINDYNGYLIQPGYVDDLANCFEEINKKSKDELALISDRAMSTGTNMSEEKMAKLYINNVKDIIKQL